MNIPTREECLKLLNTYKVPEVVQKHSSWVNKVAVFIAKKLKEKGVDINVELVDAASMLHDVLRAVQFETLIGLSDEELAEAKRLQAKYSGIRHEEAGYLELKEKYPEVAEVIKVHNFKNMNNAKTWEQKVVNYSDKRGFVDNTVTLKERFEEWEERHGKTFAENKIKPYFELEKEIFDIIELEPDKLGEYIE